MYSSDLDWCLRFSRFISCYPKNTRNSLQTVHYVILMGCFATVPILTVLTFYYKEEPLTVVALAGVSGNFTLFFHASLKLTTAFVKKSEINKLLENIKYKFWDLDDDKEIIDTVVSAKFKIRTIFFNSLVIFFLSTIIKPHIAGGNSLSYKCHRPKWLPRYALLIFEDSVCLGMVCAFAYFDIFVSTVLSMTEVQFIMLNKKLRNIYNEHDGGELSPCFDRKLKVCVDHHNFLIGFLRSFSETFSKTILLFVGNIILSMCFCLYNTIVPKQNNVDIIMDSMIHLPGGLNMIYSCYSSPAEALANQANNVERAAYFSQWYDNPTHAKKLLMVICRSKKLTELRAGGIVKVNLKMFFLACKTMVSYCMFLRTVSTME